MKKTVWALVVLGPILFAARTDTSGEEERKPKVAPLSLDGFLDEKLPESTGKKPTAKVDNSACFVCHANYQEESLVVTHAREEVGCVKCHGDSVDHRNDENNITPPDIIYPVDAIDGKCRECHEEHNVPANEVIGRWQKRCPHKTKPSEIVCTDCHFEHRLQQRTVQWDKKTRKLISGKGAATAPPAKRN